MPRSLRELLRGTRQRGRRAAQSPGRTAARLTGKILFVLVLLFLAAYAVLTDIFLLSLLAALLIGLMLRGVLPTGAIKEWARSLWSGDATEGAYEEGKRRVK